MESRAMISLDQEVRALKIALESAGAIVTIPANATDETKRKFVDMVNSCPDCRNAIMGVSR